MRVFVVAALALSLWSFTSSFALSVAFPETFRLWSAAVFALAGFNGLLGVGLGTYLSRRSR
jgi:hypothetical protein